MATATTTVSDGRHAYRPQAIGQVFGWFFLATILTSVLAYFVGYHQMLNNPGLITGTGANPAPGIAAGAALEVLLIISNVATAVVAYPVLKRESEMGAIGYVAARLVEAMFIAIGIVSALAFVLMRQEATAASNPVLGHVFVSIYYRAT
jgi:flagellar biogenesis protein FliO